MNNKHLEKEFKPGRRYPTLWAFFHLRLKKESFWYRGQHVHFYEDDQGQQMYTYLFKQSWSFGAYNMSYKEDAKAIIDYKLDRVAVVERTKGPNGVLEYLYDRDGKRKIFLEYKGITQLISDKKKLKGMSLDTALYKAQVEANRIDDAEKEIYK